MLTDILKTASWEPVADGVRMYRLIPDKNVVCGTYTLNDRYTVQQPLELFFCCGGSFTIQCKNGDVLKVGREESILLSEYLEACSIVVQEPPMGCCLVMDPESCFALKEIYHTLGHTAPYMEQVRIFLREQGGYLQIRHGSWNQSVFSILRSLPDSKWGAYCVLKAAELFYLLDTHYTYQTLSGDPVNKSAVSTYLTEVLVSIGAYVENHLDEKLTISLLCRQFNLSPTTLKNKFREFYGQPIHSWILYRRVQRAAELLRSTDMTVLQIAQSVGYESVSQFNVVFRRTFGTAPSLYRKNVRYKRKMADSV